MLARKFVSYRLHMVTRDNKKQAEMPYFHCGFSRQEKC